MKIKVCGITRKEDFIALDKLGVDFAGFIFYEKSKRFVGENANVLFENLFSKHVKKTGVFVNEAIENVLAKAEQFQFDCIQLHGDESPEFCEAIRKNYLVLKAFPIDIDFSFPELEQYQDACDYFLFDAKGKLPGGNSITFDWKLLEHYKLEIPFFLSGGIAPQHVAQIRAFSHPAFYGIDVNSGFEISPGIKNIPMLQTFVQQLKRAA
ncbi:MAG: phosphoribosylanthranilate isomerase [Chitinophagales bacterium]|nr:phosphoribosylanthranilate isomerase [Chitinophagales bacterium]